ncbi:hypothetical protein ACFYXM_12800 [Streptomyces sp. NPDC002476]|uniref:hypothetical protein n=1 Tax=Streptomyces sp. NPDC002476 TaxID=3364648 RepID=UPI00368DCAEF
MTVVEAAAEAPDESAVSEEDKPMRPTAPQQSEKHRYLLNSGNAGQFKATLLRVARNRTAGCRDAQHEWFDRPMVTST